MKRRSPVRHPVSGYRKRDGSQVPDHGRGRGTRAPRRSPVVGDSDPLDIQTTEDGWLISWMGAEAQVENVGEDSKTGLNTAYIAWITSPGPGMGFGREFYNRIEQEMIRQRMSQIMVDSNPGVEGFWEKMGFSYEHEDDEKVMSMDGRHYVMSKVVGG